MMYILFKLVMKIENSASKIIHVFYLRSSEIKINLNFISEKLLNNYMRKLLTLLYLPLHRYRYVKFNCHPLLFNFLQGEDSKVRKFSIKRNT